MKEVKILFASYLLNNVVSEIKESGVERYLIISKITGQWRKDLKHFENFLASVMKKLSNEKFVANAKPEVVAIENKKKADAEEKIKLLKESLDKL